MALGYPHADRDGTVYTDLATALARRGCDVRVLAPSLDDGFEGARVEQGVTVVRARIPPFLRVGLVRKALAYLSVPWRYGRALARHAPGWQPDWLVVYTPPVTLAPLVQILKRRLGCRSYLILHDLFPQNAVDLGMLRRGGVRHRAFRLLARWYYRVSDVIGVMSPANARALHRLHPTVPASKVVEFPLWAGGAEDDARDRAHERAHERADQRARLGVGDDDTLFVLGGNLGVPQRSDVAVDLAERVADDPRIVIAIVGDGTERARVVTRVQHAARAGARVHWLPRMDRARFVRFLSAADVGLVTLDGRFTVPNIPSRSLGYAAAGVPVLALTDVHTDLFEAYVGKHGFGWWAPVDDLDAAERLMRQVAAAHEERTAKGQAGRDAVQGAFTADHAAARLLAQFDRFQATRDDPA